MSQVNKMAPEEDDLEFNPFYQQLQTKYQSAFKIAQDKCYLICIPHSKSLQGVPIDNAFVELHILRPSPYFQGQYVTTDRGYSKTVHLEDSYLHTGEGFKEEVFIKILSEEVGYNQDYKPFKIYTIARPFHLTSPQSSRKQLSRAGIVDPFVIKTSLEDTRDLLHSFKEHKAVLEKLNLTIQQFNTNYMIVHGYLQDTAHRLREICSEAAQEVLKANRHPHRSDRRLVNNLTLAVESYVVGGVHDKVFTAICGEYEQQDRNLSGKLTQLSSITADKLGASKHFCFHLPAAAVQLAHLDELATPLEKMTCLKTTLEVITESANSLVLVNLTGDEDVPCITSDDLIPLLVTVIADTNCSHLASNIFYMDNFRWTASLTDDIGYSFVTFKAAVEFIKSTDFSHLQSSSDNADTQLRNGLNVLNKEKRSSNLSMGSLEGGSEAVPGGSDSDAKPRRTSRFDVQLDRIVRMLDSSVSVGSTNTEVSPTKSIFADADVSSRRVAPPAPVTTNSSAAPLGDFLSALQNDEFDSSYGKQS